MIDLYSVFSLFAFFFFFFASSLVLELIVIYVLFGDIEGESTSMQRGNIRKRHPESFFVRNVNISKLEPNTQY